MKIKGMYYADLLPQTVEMRKKTPWGKGKVVVVLY
jgi:hypothetical protein